MRQLGLKTFQLTVWIIVTIASHDVPDFHDRPMVCILMGGMASYYATYFLFAVCLFGSWIIGRKDRSDWPTPSEF